MQTIGAAFAALSVVKPQPDNNLKQYKEANMIAAKVESIERRVKYIYGVDGQCTGMVIFDN